MPRRPLQPCGWPGCTSVQPAAYCTKHDRQRKRSTHKPEHQRLYGRRWRRMRAVQLAKEPWCARCLERGDYVLATDVDHVERHEGDPEKFYNGKLESLCHADHSAKTAIEVGLNDPPGLKKF